MKFLAEGRTAEVFLWDDSRVLKLDRPEWTGLSHYEAGILGQLDAAGVAAPKVFDTVTLDGRTGVVLEHLVGPSLAEVVSRQRGRGDRNAVEFAGFHILLHRPIVGLPDQIARLAANIEHTSLAASTKAELLAMLDDLDDGERLLCHGDLNAQNVIMTPSGPVAIDWLTATCGVPAADFARTLVLLGWPGGADRHLSEFADSVRLAGLAQRGIDEHQLASWVRVIAAARLDEGFTGSEAAWLASVAAGELAEPADS